MSRVRIAVIGLGGIGKRHARNFAALGCSVRTYDPAVKPESYDLDEGVVFAKSSLEEALDGSHACVIATPPDSHIEIAWKALGAGCHLMIEKPVSTDLTDLGHLFAACGRADRVHFVAYPWRYDLGMRAKKAALEGLGDIRRVTTRYGYGTGNPTALKMGAVLDCSHAIDYLRWMFGEIAALRADITPYATEAHLDVRFESGATGDVNLWLNSPLEGSWTADGVKGSLDWRRHRDSPDTDAMYVEEAKHFLACIRGEAKPLTDGWDGRETLRVALAAMKSAEEGRWIAR